VQFYSFYASISELQRNTTNLLYYYLKQEKKDMEILSEAVSEKAVDCTVLERHGSEHFQVGVSEMNGWRPSMEDAHVIHLQNDGGYFGILDGHGGVFGLVCEKFS